MTAGWAAEDLRRLDAAHELEIAVHRADGTSGRPTPIWVVVAAGGQAYVRSWYRRDTGWFGDVLRTGRARVGVPGLEADVVVDDVGEGTPELRAAVDAAYRTKYGAGVDAMVDDRAAATTLRLRPRSALSGSA